MIVLRPGQLCTIKRRVYRAIRGCSCEGCDLEGIEKCPNILNFASNKKCIDCNSYNIILKKIDV